MQDKSTATGVPGTAATGLKVGGAIAIKDGTVRINENDLAMLTKKAIEGAGINFDLLNGEQKEAFVGQAIGALTGVSVQKTEELYGKLEPAVPTEFRKFVLQEAKNLPVWDTDEFIKGYVYTGAAGRGIVGSTSTRTEELQHSTR
jgi:hypothetical protein